MAFDADTNPTPWRWSSEHQPAKRHGRYRSRYDSAIDITPKARILPFTDGRGKCARRFKALAIGIADDLGGAGVLSEAKRQLVRRASMLSAQSEHLEAQWAKGEAEFDIYAYAVLANALRRILEDLGLERRARPVSANAIPAMDITEFQSKARRVINET